MQETKKDPHRAGRKPIKRSDAFYQSILNDYEEMSIRDMAASRNVSRTTIWTWLKAARRWQAENEEVSR